MTETGNHATLAVPALEAGKHVLCTKPLEASLEAADAMIEAADEAGTLLAVDFDLRYTSAPAQRLKDAIDDGLLGRMLYADVSLKTYRSDEYYRYRGGWRGTRKLDGGGALANQGIHQLDLLMMLLGLPDTVQAHIWTQNHDIEAEDLGTAIWNYADGRVGRITSTTSFPVDVWYTRHEVHGTRGAVIWSGGYANEELWFLDGKLQESPSDYPLDLTPAPERFARAVRLDEPLPVDGREARRSLAMLTAMYASASQGGIPVQPRWLRDDDVVV